MSTAYSEEMQRRRRRDTSWERQEALLTEIRNLLRVLVERTEPIEITMREFDLPASDATTAPVSNGDSL